MQRNRELGVSGKLPLVPYLAGVSRERPKEESGKRGSAYALPALPRVRGGWCTCHVFHVLKHPDFDVGSFSPLSDSYPFGQKNNSLLY